MRKDRGEITEKTLSGTIAIFSGKEGAIEEVADQVALIPAGNQGDGGALAYLSMVGKVPNVKAARAMLHSSGTTASVGESIYRWGTRGQRSARNLKVVIPGGGYRSVFHSLGLGTAHAIFVSRRPGFLLDGTDETLWNELSSVRYTTPLLRSWIPWLRSTLTAREYLVPCVCLNCDCWYANLTTETLDDAVRYGLRTSNIKIERPGDSK